jgi:hypothetical protein
MKFIFDTDESFSFETLRAVGYTVYGGADIGEVITTAERITPGDTESWYSEWRALADRIATIADKCAADGHVASAGSAYLRASNYYRTAEFFLRDDPWNDPRAADTSARAIETFRSARNPGAPDPGWHSLRGNRARGLLPQRQRGRTGAYAARARGL